MKKYELTDETMVFHGITLHRIKALKDFGNVKSGEIGGWIESEHNLSHNGDCWVADNAKVFDDARVFCDAEIHGDSHVKCYNDYIVFKNFWSSGRYFTWTRSNNMWKVGCFYGTGEDLVKKAYADSEKSGREYERVVRYVESILADEAKEVQR